MNDPAPVPNQVPDERLVFEMDFVRTWHRAWGAPSLILIDWARARTEYTVLAIDGKTAALRQLWDLRRETDYLRRPLTGYIRKPGQARKRQGGPRAP